MAKINQYPAKTVPSNNDEFVLHDPASGSTKKMTRGDLIGGAPLPANSVNGQAIADGSVTPEKKSGGFYTTLYTFPAGTGSRSITGFGFRPKMVVVETAITTETTSYNATGRVVDGPPIVQNFRASVATDAARRSVSGITATFLLAATSSTPFVGAVTSFDSDGITVNVTTDGGAAFRNWIITAYA